MSWPRRGQRGTAHLEVVLIAPVMILLVGLALSWSRVAIAGDGVSSAAGAAARAAALERTPQSATAAAQQIAAATLTSQNLKCATTSITVNTSGFATPAGQPASVSATVTCVVSLNDLGVPLGGTRTITKTSTAPLDTYRERGR